MNLEQRLKRIEEKISNLKSLKEGYEFSMDDLYADLRNASYYLEKFRKQLMDKNHSNPRPKDLKDLANNLLIIYGEIVEMEKRNEY